MPGKLAAQRSHADAKRAALMAADGMTARQIAIALNCRPEQVKARVLLGQRLLDADPPKTEPTHGCGHMQGRGAA